MGGLFGSRPKPVAAPIIPSPDSDGVRAAGEAERERRTRRRGAVATVLSSLSPTLGGSADGMSTTTGGR